MKMKILAVFEIYISVPLRSVALSFINHLRNSMKWTGNHLIFRTKNLEYGARGNDTKSFFSLSKEKLRNGSSKTVLAGYAKNTYLI